MNVPPTEKQIKRIKGIANSIANRRHLLAGVDKFTLAKDLEQEGWLAWVKTPEKEDSLRYKAAAGAMSDYWRRWKWGIHYRSNISDDGYVISTTYYNKNNTIVRPPMNHVPLHDLQDVLDGEAVGTNIEKNLMSHAHIEESIWANEVITHIKNTFIDRKNSKAFGQTLWDAILNEGYRGAELSGRFIGGSNTATTVCNATKVRCRAEIREVVSNLL